jgi:hypothetical protein
MKVDGESLLAYCEAWWKGYRPCAYTEIQHLNNPAVNIPDDAAQVLARYVADLIKRRNEETWRARTGDKK